MGSSPSKPAVLLVDSRKSSNVSSVDEKRPAALLDALSQDGSLTLSNVSAWESEVSKDPKQSLARTILVHSDIRDALTKRPAFVSNVHVFNTQLDYKTGAVTNQKSSGRCWLFATTNVLRYEIMKKLKLENFQLSQAHLFFWDKLNKSNYYLETIIENAELPVDDRLINHLSDDLISDGGQWDMVVNLVMTYGVVPQSIFPESTHSSMSAPLNNLLKTKLREHALKLRKLHFKLKADSFSAQEIMSALRAEKEVLMREIYTIMTATLGVPPMPTEKFVWDYNTADGKTGKWEGTSIEFFEKFGASPYSPEDSFSLINDPRNAYGKLYTVAKLGNIWGGRPILYVNTEIEDMKSMVVKMIKAGAPVFFGCDVGQFSERQAGIMDTNLYAYETTFDITLGLTKAERLQINESSMTHAMVITAVHLDDEGKPVRYKVENSWGPDVGSQGYFVMTDSWFEQFVYQVVVPKSLTPSRLVKVLNQEAVVLPPWDPMGTLA